MAIPDDLHVNPTDEEWLRLSEQIELEDANGDCLPYRFMDRLAVNALLRERMAVLGWPEGEGEVLRAQLEFELGGQGVEFVADMANIGHEYMKAVAGKDYNQSPVEIYHHLVDEVEELRDAERRRLVLAGEPSSEKGTSHE
jgi:hypothetical protein